MNCWLDADSTVLLLHCVAVRCYCHEILSMHNLFAFFYRVDLVVCLQLFKDLFSNTCFLEAKKGTQKSKPLFSYTMEIFIPSSLCLQDNSTLAMFYFFRKLQPSSRERTKALTSAISEILWRAGDSKEATVAL